MNKQSNVGCSSIYMLLLLADEKVASANGLAE